MWSRSFTASALSLSPAGFRRRTRKSLFQQTLRVDSRSRKQAAFHNSPRLIAGLLPRRRAECCLAMLKSGGRRPFAVPRKSLRWANNTSGIVCGQYRRSCIFVGMKKNRSRRLFKDRHCFPIYFFFTRPMNRSATALEPRILLTISPQISFSHSSTIALCLRSSPDVLSAIRLISKRNL